MMKIGILTHHYVSNFGAFLQAYSLRKALLGLCPEADVRFVNFVPLKHKLINTGGCFRFDPRHESFRAWLAKARLPLTFQRAVKKSLPRTRRVRTAAQVNALGLDALIVGSDEVWNFSDGKSAHPLKYGCGLSVRPLIAYAPSVGKSTEVSRLSEEMKRGLTNFTAFSARDDNTRALIQTLFGQTPAPVPDPTFLFKPEGAFSPRVQRLTRAPYALFYHCAPLPEAVRAEMAALARENGIRLIGAGEYDKLYSEVSVNLDPFEWCALFERARCVITGTFHGAVFAILNQKPVTVLPNNPTRRAKLGALLSSLNLSSRMADPQTVSARALLFPAEDTGCARARVAQMREEGLTYLRNALQTEGGMP